MYHEVKNRSWNTSIIGVLECSDANNGLGGSIIGDSGITCPGDVSKTWCVCGFCNDGGQFAGHSQNPGEVIECEKTGKKMKRFYGMSSK